MKRHGTEKTIGQNIFLYMIGNMILFIAAFAAISALMQSLAGRLYKKISAVSAQLDDEDDWGPVIERKNKNKE